MFSAGPGVGSFASPWWSNSTAAACAISSAPVYALSASKRAFSVVASLASIQALMAAFNEAAAPSTVMRLYGGGLLMVH